MPLTAVHNGKQVVSIFMTDDDWAQLRSKASKGELNMSCGTPAITRVSSLGLRHFAHRRAVECGHPGCTETPQHQAAKAAVAQAADAAGWNVTIEDRAPGGEWVADVLAEKGGRRVALEIQWSRQSAEDFSYRQERYRQAGVECFWFINRRNRSTAVEAKVPFAVLTGDSAPFGIEAAGDIFTNEGPALEATVTEALEGTDVDEALIRITEVEFSFESKRCTHCKQSSTTWRVSALWGTTRCGKSVQLPGIYRSYSTEKHEALFSAEADMALAAATDDGGTWPPLTKLRVHFSHAPGKEYLAQGCAHCPHGYLEDFDVSRAGWSQIKTAPLSQVEVRHLVSHRCLDSGQGFCSPSNVPWYGAEQRGPSDVDHRLMADQGLTVDDAQCDACDAAAKLVGFRSNAERAKTRSGARAVKNSLPRRGTRGSAHEAEVDPRAYLQSCDHCTPDNPCAVVHECLCRRLEAVSLSDGGYWHHVCDSISRGERREEGVDLLRRLLQRAVDSRVLHGPGGAYAGRTAPHLHYQEQAA